MATELAALAVAAILGFAHAIAAWHAANLEKGYRGIASAGDPALLAASGTANRLDRARRNYVEAFAFFGAAILVVHASGAASPGTAGAAWAFVAARTLYLIALPSGASIIAWIMAGVASVATLTLLLAPVVPYW